MDMLSDLIAESLELVISVIIIIDNNNSTNPFDLGIENNIVLIVISSKKNDAIPVIYAKIDEILNKTDRPNISLRIYIITT